MILGYKFKLAIRDIVMGKYRVVLAGGVDKAPFIVEAPIGGNRAGIVPFSQGIHGKEICLLSVKAGFLNPTYPTFGKFQNPAATVAYTGVEAAVRKPFGKHRLVAADRKPTMAKEVFQFLNRVKFRKCHVRVEETYQAIFQKNTTRFFLSALAGSEVEGVYFLTGKGPFPAGVKPGQGINKRPGVAVSAGCKIVKAGKNGRVK